MQILGSGRAHPGRWPWQPLAGALLMVAMAACGAEESEPPAPPYLGPTCDPAGIVADMERVPAADFAIYWETGGTAARVNVELAQADLQSYLGTLWGQQELSLGSTAPDGSASYSLWVSTSTEARDAAGATVDDGYALRRVDDGGAHLLIVYGTSEDHLVAGVYALLEQLGARFFHPMQELVPSLEGIYWPAQLAIERSPAFAVRGVQIHLLHPLEYFKPFNEPGAQNLADAKRFVDWLVKTGQNHVQWSILRTVDLEAWKPHAAAIIDYAHGRGVTAGAVVDLWGGASLQNAYDLITVEDHWEEELESQLDYLMTLPWDLIEMGLGEFLGHPPEQVLAWLNHTTAYMADTYPDTDVSITNHVGDYPDMWIEYQGETIFYYHLSGLADPRLVNNAHTVFFFDLFRDWGGYNHDDFHLQQEFIWEQLPTRPMRYMPESAYWCSADIDVPVFLPEYIHSRWVDIQGLAQGTVERGLPPLDGHVLFTSGHEWGYWLTDYLAAKMIWDPDADWQTHVADYARAYGNCGAEAEAALGDLIELQTTMLFDQRLVPYLSAEDLHDDMGYLMDITTHPPRVPFHELLTMTDGEVASFEQDVLGGVTTLTTSLGQIEASLSSLCARAVGELQPWCAELLDGVQVTRLRGEHASWLYQAILAKRRGEDGSGALAQAMAVTDAAAQVVARREASYRFDVEILTGSYVNPTRYPFGYLKMAHTQCLWHRQEEQAGLVLETGTEPGVAALPSCQE